MTVANNGPLYWVPIIESLKSLFGPKTLIAGGAVRDFVILGDQVGPKDIDVFVEVEDELDFELTLTDVAALDGFDTAPKITTNTEAYGVADNKAFREAVVGTARVYYGGYRFLINIIGRRPEDMETPEKLVSTFDHSLCGFWTTDGSTIQSTDDAKASIASKTVKAYVDGPSTEQRVVNVLDRIGWSQKNTSKTIVIDEVSSYLRCFQPNVINVNAEWRIVD